MSVFDRALLLAFVALLFNLYHEPPIRTIFDAITFFVAIVVGVLFVAQGNSKNSG